MALTVEISLMSTVSYHLPIHGFLQLVLTSLHLADLFLPTAMIICNQIIHSDKHLATCNPAMHFDFSFNIDSKDLNFTSESTVDGYSSCYNIINM